MRNSEIEQKLSSKRDFYKFFELNLQVTFKFIQTIDFKNLILYNFSNIDNTTCCLMIY